MAHQRKLVLVVPANLEPLGDVLCRDAHVVVVDGAAEALHQAVDQRRVSHAQPVEPGLVAEQIGGLAHALGAAGDGDFHLAGPDELHSRVDRLQAGGALPVDGQGRHGVRDARTERGEAGSIAGLGRLESVAHHHLVDHPRLQAGPVDGRPDGRGPEIGRGYVLQAASEPAHRRSRAADYDRILHFLLLMSSVEWSSASISSRAPDRKSANCRAYTPVLFLAPLPHHRRASECTSLAPQDTSTTASPPWSRR